MARSTATTWWLVGLTPVIMLLTHYLAVLPHEFSHSVAAWIVGIKPVPGDITWGGTSLWNVTLLAHVDENVDYSAALAAGRYREVAVAAAAGPVIGNALPYLVVRGLIFRGSFARSRPVWLYVVFWYLFYGVANLYDYVPTRVFADDGDVTHFVEGSHVDRWWIYAVGTALVVWAIADLYRTVLPRVLGFCDFSDLRGGRALVLVAATAMLFGYFAIPALEESDPLSSFMGRTSLLLIPVVLVATWRRVVLDDLPTEPRRAEVLRLAPVGSRPPVEPGPPRGRPSPAGPPPPTRGDPMRPWSSRRAVVIAAAAAAALSGCGAPPAAPSAAPGASSAAPAQPAYAAPVRDAISAAMKAAVIPGAVVAISSPSRGDWSGTFGTRTIGANDPPTIEDHFRVGSITKTMTSTVVLQLVQEHKLALDDPISKYRQGVPGGDRITIADLAEMRSGLFSYTFDPGFNATLDSDPGKAWTPDELLAIAFSHPVDAPPDTTFEYCNTNIVLLGLVIEQLTGEPLEKAFADRIFTPLGMTQSSLPARADAGIPDPHPQGYAFGTNVSSIKTYTLPADEQAQALAGHLQPHDVTTANPSWAWAAGGAISTVPDLSTYVKALVSGNGLLDAATQKIRTDSIRPTDPAHPGAAGYGIGIASFGPLIGHDGQLPGFMTFAGQDPKTGLTIVIATNLATTPSGEGSALTLLKAILPIFYPGFQVPGNPAAVPSATGSPGG